MASSLYFIVLLCLTSGLWSGANAKCPGRGPCCEKCPDGWTQYDSRCFIFHFQEKDWADAEVTCVDIGGNLASIRTADDYSALRNMVNGSTGTDKATWIGGYDAVKEGVWKWSDGKKFDFNGWHKGEPNNSGGAENCMEINFREQDFVNDAKCDEKRSFICAKDTSS
ncbi:galactose-specific lectin nattectin-like [Thunnus albacares]|uniref:galactose-specific lectin nattectin-like n=1 Tax=Thunnus albacares TaxID=8236 RepID=UPI001CF675A5|nr:galactose-specific lectin nattectin-like [Thunnus albacares]